MRERLSALGRTEGQPLSRILILHRAPSVTRRAADTALDALKGEKLVEFATPVLRDSGSGLRQVLTDEIVLRLKSGRAAPDPGADFGAPVVAHARSGKPARRRR